MKMFLSLVFNQIVNKANILMSDFIERLSSHYLFTIDSLIDNIT